MAKIIRIDDELIVMFSTGVYLKKKNVSDEFLDKVARALTEEELYALMCPNYKEKLAVYNDAKEILDLVEDSKLLTRKGDSIYWESVSQLSLPPELVKSILTAEVNNEWDLVETYKNFWTLMSLNPDEECRKNLFWFLKKWGLKIAKCGFFVAYRNVVPYQILEDGSEIFTDQHSGTTRIKIGEMVTMPREDCDRDSSHSCSRGLHAGGAGWLERNYYGTQGMVVLINPSDVTAVPYRDDYGKLRTCAYLPIAKAEFSEDNHVIPLDEEDGFDCSYVSKVIYEGIMGTEKDSTYRIIIPEIPGINKVSISDSLLNIAMKCITDKVEKDG